MDFRHRNLGSFKKLRNPKVSKRTVESFLTPHIVHSNLVQKHKKSCELFIQGKKRVWLLVLQSHDDHLLVWFSVMFRSCRLLLLFLVVFVSPSVHRMPGSPALPCSLILLLLFHGVWRVYESIQEGEESVQPIRAFLLHLF